MTQTTIFFNTTHLNGYELSVENSNALSLQESVHQLFKSNPKTGFIWSDICTMLGVEVCKYGSVKRSITNLLNEGKLYKSTNTKLSIFGKKAHFYFVITE